MSEFPWENILSPDASAFLIMKYEPNCMDEMIVNDKCQKGSQERQDTPVISALGMLRQKEPNSRLAWATY